MKAKKLIEVAMPIKEISAESVRDKYIHNGHLSTLHIWWARRPLPLCRATVFASLVPDPLDDNCPKAFKEAVSFLLAGNQFTESLYKPYSDIPYTAVRDEMENNLRNRLMMFIGKFSDNCSEDMRRGDSGTAQNDILSSGSLIKWESKNDKEILRIARELIWIAYNSDSSNELSFESLHLEFSELYDAIFAAEDNLYSIVDRHIQTDDVKNAEKKLEQAIHSFQEKMPIIFDPFSGGGAIPFEAARLGCRSYGNDINPVAHIIERGSAEFPQKYGKPIHLSSSQFSIMYGKEGAELAEKYNFVNIGGQYEIPNRLAFDIEFYANKILSLAAEREKNDYFKLFENKPVVALIWSRTGKCSNPSCGAEIPLLKQFYLAKKSKKSIYLNPLIDGKRIDFEIKSGNCPIRDGWVNKKSVTCPCCGSVTTIDEIKSQANINPLNERLLAIVSETSAGKTYSTPQQTVSQPKIKDLKYAPSEKMNKIPDFISGRGWGVDSWSQIFSNRQLNVIDTIIDCYESVKSILPKDNYGKVLCTYLAIWLDRTLSYSTSFARWIPQNEQLTSLFGRQAIPMIFDYPEANLFAHSTSSAYNQLDWILNFIKEESSSPFACTFNNISSGEKAQFGAKTLTAVITDPPYYDAIAYADLSDFFYVWLKRTLGDVYPMLFSTPQTPKTEECTALKFHHNNSEEEAKKHFESKLTQIFDAIEIQTSDIVSIMFAHQSTEAWTTLCNSILGARMNITGSWAIDSERDTRMNANAGAALESSVTVACRPSERRGFGNYREVKAAIVEKVREEVEKLYNLGFRGADLMTACFGQAVSEFGKYKVVEKADGSEVTVAELLDMARTSAFDSLLSGVQGDDFTRFYVGWLQMNGLGDTDFDDATKFTRIGMQVDITEIVSKKLLIREGKKQHLASAEEHLGTSGLLGSHPNDSLIDQAHRAMISYEKGDREILLKLLHDIGADDINAPFWRLLASLKELLPDGSKDLKNVQGLLGNSDNLRQESKDIENRQSKQLTFDF